MPSEPPEDVASLMQRAQLEGSQYKVFNARSGGASTDSRVSPSPADKPFVATSNLNLVPPKRSLGDVADAATPVAAARRWNVLSSLLSRAPEEDAELPAEALEVPMLVLSAGAGGAGKSTVLSTLADLLAAGGESNLVIYGERQRTLPLHFGGQQVVPGRVRSLISPAPGRGELHFYTPDEAAPEAVRDWLPRTVNPMASELSRVLCELSPDELDVAGLRRLACCELRLLIPDISSVLAVSHSLHDAPKDACAVYYLLNQYDDAVAFHRDVRARLAATLGTRLLPIAIRRSDYVPEALAAGQTVIGYEPKSGVAEDFRALATWVQGELPRHDAAPLKMVR